MSFWDKLRGAKSNSQPGRSGKLDYLSEGLALEKQGDYDAALTSYRLALREQPNNVRVLENMAIASSRLGQADDAIRSYKRALSIEPKLSGAHYGLAYLLLKRGEISDAAYHLEAFLMDAPTGPESERWVAHAKKTLDELHTPAQSDDEMDPAEFPETLD
ncbi:MAG: tetratricopeptide repeat protein [Gemmatimonadota bacterium]|nr:tetratricopeptide repeat protein [Gemmatimonadota bacterium]